MKVKELFENEKGIVDFTVIIDISTNSQVKITEEQKKNLEEYFKKYYPNYSKNIQIFNAAVSFKTSIFISFLRLTESLTNKASLEKLVNAIDSTSFLSHFFGEDLVGEDASNVEVKGKIGVTGFPPFIISYNDIVIDCLNNMSLSGIDKMIEGPGQLDITGFGFAKDSVLGLLKLKDRNIDLFGSNNKEWAEIVDRHLQGDRNILKCQRELIQNGFKDYAKF